METSAPVCSENEEDIDVNAVLGTIDQITINLIDNEIAYRENIEQINLEQLLDKLLYLKRNEGVDEASDAKMHLLIQGILNKLEGKSELLKCKEQKLASLRQEYSEQIECAKGYDKEVNNLENKNKSLQLARKKLEQLKIKIIAYKLLTHTTFDYRTKHVCGYVLGPNNEVETFKFAANSSRKEIPCELWKKVKKVNEL